MKPKNTPAIFSSKNVQIPIESVILEGELVIPNNAKGIVLFAHGSGSSRFSSRNKFVADALHHAESGTLLFDLLTKEEEVFDEESGALRFNIEFLAKRLIAVTEWLSSQTSISRLSFGYFGASTGGAAALMAASFLGNKITAVVSRGGRPDLAMQLLPQVTASTLLIVGGNDDVVLQLNQEAYQYLQCKKDFFIVPHATHLFEEPGALEKVALSAATWFQEHWGENNAITQFKDRREAGVLLAEQLTKYNKSNDALVLGLPRGGIPVAYEIAKRLKLPLDVFIVRKLGLPTYPELAMGAIAAGDVCVVNQEIIQRSHLPPSLLEATIDKEKKELKRREQLYRRRHDFPEIKDKNIILVDDGIATGSSIQAAIRALRLHSPKHIIIAVPVAPLSSYRELVQEVDEIIVLIKASNFQAVGQYYEEFSQTTDQEVIDLLHQSDI